MTIPIRSAAAVGAAFALVLGGSAAASAAPPPSAQVAPATPGTLAECDGLIDFVYDNTTIDTAQLVPAGEFENAGTPVGEHCVVTGRMNERTSDVDGQTYAIGFEMRLPTDWAGRFLYQANGGMDGNVVPAFGSITGGQLQNGLQQGFAVLSSDAGHGPDQNPLFGLDPQARLDYGYQAVGTLTPMAKELIAAAYDRGPDTSYIAGGSNGGRHTMVAAARYADLYDGFLPVAPGFHLPQAAVAQLWGAQQWNEIAETPGNLRTALTDANRETIAASVLDRCDAADGLADGMVHDADRCAEIFDPQRDIPSCVDGQTENCLPEQTKAVLERVMAGAVTSEGDAIYSSFPWDAGIANDGWAGWKLDASLMLDPMAVGFVFSPQPESPQILADLPGYALGVDIDEKAAGIWEESIAGESAMEFMTPPDETNLDALRDTGGKMIVVHGAADGVFSPDDTAAWYDRVSGSYADATDFVRYFEVPGMAHVSGGAATDQFDALGALVDWVENGQAPDTILATARGAGNPGGENAEVPADWAADRTRPLCPYPTVATFTGGDPEDASSFECAASSEGEPEPEPDPAPTPEPEPTADPEPSPAPEPTADPTPGPGADPEEPGDLAPTDGDATPALVTTSLALLLTGGLAIAARRRRREGTR